MADRDAVLNRAIALLASVAALGNPDYLFDDDDTISGERIDQLTGLSAAATAFLVQHLDLTRRAVGEEDFEKLSNLLDFTGLQDELTFGSARFADKEDA